MAAPWKIGMFQSGMLMGSWRLPENTSYRFLELDHWIDMAKRCEEAGVDFLFMADDYGYPVVDDTVPDAAVRNGVHVPKADPAMILPALAAVTERLGLVTTQSTSVEKPPMVARKMATLDHLTKGRIGWNIVTGAGQNASARLFGAPMVEHDLRYGIATDHVELTLKLWEGCWDDDAILLDRENGVYADPAKVREIEHDGPHFRAKGLLNVPPGPQRTPMLFQAGASGPGRDLAAKFAEGVFLAAEIPKVAEQIADIRRRASSFGRDPQSLVCMMAGTFIVAPTSTEAHELRARQIATRSLDEAAASYAFFTGVDLSVMDPDKPIDPSTVTQTGRTNLERFLGPNAPTVREVLEEFQRNNVMGAPFIGDPGEVVDQAEAAVAATGADGFLVQPDPYGNFDSFLDLVMPELRARGLVVEAQVGQTLRGRLRGDGRAHLPADHPGARIRAASV
ncbi:NtaA/DmoA family FMN-dependent monooxygenase [Rathayibacter sp. VKM Ac-2754]|uniref:NtaA/DmoA family FMN-dependent monooxygenase n=1 Tax=Rathayibacter sp. VKM Ac-2754 TaxID=2609251 RepID=UPI00135B54E5|nr:NtaA/DmoA family FMN-dependent monooxygenase [Rathayibacter sp. VKM Ac-2754]MWV57758.1 NtaA/DmoA family FMN-dependent monooxygenase [Rathayibacter sp. VKM Ac-2754]